MRRRLNNIPTYFLKLAVLVLMLITTHCTKKNESGGSGNETFTFDAEITIMGNDTKPDKNVAQGSGITASNNNFTYSLPSRSVTTFGNNKSI